MVRLAAVLAVIATSLTYVGTAAALDLTPPAVAPSVSVSAGPVSAGVDASVPDGSATVTVSTQAADASASVETPAQPAEPPSAAVSVTAPKASPVSATTATPKTPAPSRAVAAARGAPRPVAAPVPRRVVAATLPSRRVVPRHAQQAAPRRLTHPVAATPLPKPVSAHRADVRTTLVTTPVPPQRPFGPWAGGAARFGIFATALALGGLLALTGLLLLLRPGAARPVPPGANARPRLALSSGLERPG